MLGPDEKPLYGARVSLHTPHEGGGVSSRGYFTDKNGLCELLVPLEGGNVSVEDRNGEYRQQRFPMLKKDIVVQLEKALTISLRFKGMPKLPDNLCFRFYFAPKGLPVRRGTNQWTQSVHPRMTPAVISTRATEVHVPDPGEYRLTLTPVLVSEGGRRRRDFMRGQLRFDLTVKKPEQAGTKVDVEIPLDDGDVEAIKDLIEMAKEAKKGSEDRDR